MTRKSLILTLLIILSLCGATGSVLALFVRHEPAFYSRAAATPGESRSRASGQFVSEMAQLVQGVVNNRQWSAHFKAEQINSYLAEDFLKQHGAEPPLPEGITEPRVALDTNRIRLGFRYGYGKWSTVISLDMHVWLVAKEPNMVALEFQGMHAGGLPVAVHSWLERQLDSIRRRNISASWYRQNAHPVLLLRFEADRSNPSFRLRELSLQPGMIMVKGHSLDSSARVGLEANIVGQ